ncbi:hypothetical protein D3C83_218720 [compost metagenome]
MKPAGNVVTNTNNGLWLRIGGEQIVEGNDAPGFRRRYGQPATDVVERAMADPADRILDGVKHRQE